MEILLVEDEMVLGDSTVRGLSKRGFAVDWVTNTADATRALSNRNFQGILLDLGLPDGDGVEYLRRLREQGNKLPIIIITARDSIKDRVAGLESGADDYLVKPYSLDELAARLETVQRRLQGRASSVLVWGNLALDHFRRQITMNDTALALSRREFSLLSVLMESPDRIVSRETIESRIYDDDSEPGSNAIEVHISNLRKKIGAKTIKTVRGMGYILVADGPPRKI